jgi:hypothetical protein
MKEIKRKMQFLNLTGPFFLSLLSSPFCLQVLKLSKDKWEEARDHAMRAVVCDGRMRIWYADKDSMDVGLLFACRLGGVDLDRPVGLLTKKAQDGVQTTMEATLMAQQTPGQRDQVRALQPRAAEAWWQPGHPGWAIYPVDSEQFLSSGTLEPAAVAGSIMALPPATPQALGLGSGAVISPALASAFGPGGALQGEALLRAMGMPSAFLPPIAAAGGLGPALPLRAGAEDRGTGEHVLKSKNLFSFMRCSLVFS